MKLNKLVQSNVFPQIEFKSTFVRVPINITQSERVETIGEEEVKETFYLYDEEIYDKDEYVKNMDNKTLIISATTLDLDFRVMEVEFTLEDLMPQPMVLSISNKNIRGVMDMTPYEMCKVVIVGGMYTREDMEYKISVYVKRGRMTQVEADELIALMDARDLLNPPSM